MRNSNTVVALALVVLAGGLSPREVVAQGSEAEAAMVAAGEWARARVPPGALRLDPHRTGRSTESAVAKRVAAALGADLGTMEQTRTCGDVMDPSTCELGVAALLAIGAPAIQGDRAVVRVYAWYRQDNARSPVGKTSWEVRLRRTGTGWAVEGQARLD